MYITAGENKNTNRFHAMILRRHDTPSGSERWLLQAEGNIGYDDAETAKMETAKIIPHVAVFLGNDQGFAYPYAQ